MRKLLITLVAVFALLWLAWRLLFGGWTTEWRQRLTLAVETPAGEASGSAVTEVTSVDSSGALVTPEASGVRNYLRGEAVAVEVLPGRWLFALLDGSDDWQRAATHWVYPAYGLAKLPDGSNRSYADAMREVKRKPHDTPVPLPREGWPLMVTFGDIADPASVKRVNPDDLAATFGPGVRLKAVTLEITRAAVTEGRVQQSLGWLCDHLADYRRLSGEAGAIGDNRLANRLGPGNFIIGVCK